MEINNEGFFKNLELETEVNAKNLGNKYSMLNAKIYENELDALKELEEIMDSSALEYDSPNEILDKMLNYEIEVQMSARFADFCVKYSSLDLNTKQLSYIYGLRHINELSAFFMAQGAQKIDLSKQQYKEIIFSAPQEVFNSSTSPPLLTALSLDKNILGEETLRYLLDKAPANLGNSKQNQPLLSAIQNSNTLRLSTDFLKSLIEKFHVTDSVQIIEALLEYPNNLSAQLVNTIVQELNVNEVVVHPGTPVVLSRVFDKIVELSQLIPLTPDTWKIINDKLIISHHCVEVNAIQEVEHIVSLNNCLCKNAKMPNFVWNKLFTETNNSYIEFKHYLAHKERYDFQLTDESIKKITKKIKPDYIFTILDMSHKLSSQQRNIILENLIQQNEDTAEHYKYYLTQMLEGEVEMHEDFLIFMAKKIAKSNSLFTAEKEECIISALNHIESEDILLKLINILPENEGGSGVINHYIKMEKVLSPKILDKMLEKYSVNIKDSSGNIVLGNIFLQHLVVAPEQLSVIIKRSSANCVNNNRETVLNIALQKNRCLTKKQWDILVDKTNSAIKPKKGLSCKQLLLQTGSDIDIENQQKINNYYIRKFLKFLDFAKRENKAEINTESVYKLLAEKIEGKATKEVQYTIEKIFSIMKRLNEISVKLSSEDRIKLQQEYPQLINDLYEKSAVIDTKNEEELKMVVNILEENINKIHSKYIHEENKDLKTIKKYLQAAR